MANKKIYKTLMLSICAAIWAALIPGLATLFGKPFIVLDAVYYFLIVCLAGCITTLVLIGLIAILKLMVKKGEQ